ncbi:hypothetical protein F2Q69_00022948 [Brassica cretica]|uniref:Secreted protein n=1 Tax=Brassica cretica TaxID=69181 RepID=A0A8S9Q2S3_BRACR|nr:hypothetical protein F2Q69_00022948 [Brassica cretica]
MCSSSYGCSLLLYVSSVISTVLIRCCFADEAIWSYHRFSMLARDGVLGSSDSSFLVGASCFDCTEMWLSPDPSFAMLPVVVRDTRASLTKLDKAARNDTNQLE